MASEHAIHPADGASPAVPVSARRARRYRHGFAPWLLLTPWLVGLFCITLGPMVASLYLSFTNYNLLGQLRWVGFNNYVELLTDDPRFYQAASVTVKYVVAGVPLQLMFALAIALILNQGLPGLTFYRSMYYLPSLLGSSVAIALLWRQIFGSAGLVNQVLGAIGFTQLPAWIATPEYALDTIILLHVWTFGSPMIIFLAGLRQIPRELYEAASVDGAGRLTRFWQITLPMLSPVIFFNVVLQTISAFQSFTQSFVVSGGTGGPVDSTLMYTLYMYQQAFTHFRMGYASSMAWLLVITVASLTGLNFWLSRYWVHYGGDK
ncbi:MAG: sugar ABC transporter permease [Chloroflexota bacterium]